MLVILTLNDLSAFPSINGLTRTCFGAYLRGRGLLCLVNMSVCLYLIYRVDADPAGQSVPFRFLKSPAYWKQTKHSY